MRSLLHLSRLCLKKPPAIVFGITPQRHIGGVRWLSKTPLCQIVCAVPTLEDEDEDIGNLMIFDYIADPRGGRKLLEKRVPMELLKETGTIGASHGWVATLKDGVVRLQDDLNPSASDTDPKRISLPPLVTLPHCQTQLVTNVAMSSSPEEEDCVVAVKYLGPQLSFCRPAQSKSEWINIRIENPCFFSSPVMFSKKEGMFRIAGSGGHLIGSWDHQKHSKKPKFQRLWFQNPKMTETERDLLDSCYTNEHLVESEITGETFMVKLYKKTDHIIEGIPRMQTEAVMVFKIDEEGNAVYTEDIGNQSIYVTSSEALCNLFSTRLCLCRPNYVKINDVDERRSFKLADPKWKRRQSST